MQLTAENVPKPTKPVSSDTVTVTSSQNPILDMGGEGGEEVEEHVDSGNQQQQDEPAGLFSGMAVSGERAPRPSRPTQPVQPVRQVKPSPPTSRVKKQQQEEPSSFGDLLGLVCMS